MERDPGARVRSRGARWILGAAVALILSLGAFACGSGGGGSHAPAAIDPGTVVFTGAPQNKVVKFLVFRAGEWKITAITVTGLDQVFFKPIKQCLNHVFVVGKNETKECEEIVQ